MNPTRTRSGSTRLPLRPLVRLLTLSLTLVVVGLVVLARAVPLTGRLTLVVAGPSMTPAISVGSVIIVEPVAAASLAVGDVVSIKNGPDRAIYTHRVVRLVERDDGLWIETKGDANPAADPTLAPASAILGRVSMAVPYAGYVVALVSHPSGVILFVALALLLLLAGSIVDPRQTASTPLPA